MIVNNFTLTRVEQNEGYSIGYLTSDDGKDWYEAQNLFDKDKLKIEFESNGIITRMSMDVSELWPLGKSVADIELKNVPNGVNEKGMWLFDGVKIIAVATDHVLAAKLKSAKLINSATQVITTLQDAIELGMDRPDDLRDLNEWKKYRVQLNRVDVSLAPDIRWPDKPSQ